jgi:hypothetical protein
VQGKDRSMIRALAELASLAIFLSMLFVAGVALQ